jgi:hypothetical protein
MTDIEAIEWLKQIRDKYIHGGDQWFDEQRCRAIEYAIECIYKRSKWIPISARLPETNQQVLFCGDIGRGETLMGFYIPTTDGASGFLEITGHSEGDLWHRKDAVKYWMPLPVSALEGL